MPYAQAGSNSRRRLFRRFLAIVYRKARWFRELHIHMGPYYALATRTDFLDRGVVWDRRRLQGLKTSFEKIGRNVHVHSVRFLRTRILPASQWRPWEPYLGNSDTSSNVSSDVSGKLVREAGNTLDEEISACSHGLIDIKRANCSWWYYISVTDLTMITDHNVVPTVSSSSSNSCSIPWSHCTFTGLCSNVTTQWLILQWPQILPNRPTKHDYEQIRTEFLTEEAIRLRWRTVSTTDASHQMVGLHPQQWSPTSHQSPLGLIYMYCPLTKAWLGLFGHVARPANDVPANQLLRPCCKTF